MKRFLMFIYLVIIFGTISCKDLHIKEEDALKEMLVVNSNNNHAYVERERFARHVEATVTESIINHMMKELRRRHPQINQPKSVSKMMRNLKRRLKHYVHQKKPHRTKPLPAKMNETRKKKNQKAAKNHEILKHV